MINPSPFTLIYQSADEPEMDFEGSVSVDTAADPPAGGGAATESQPTDEPTGEAAATVSESATMTSQVATLNEIAPELVEYMKTLNPNLRRTLLASSFAQSSTEEGHSATDNLALVIKDLQRHKKVLKIALWDVNAWIGPLGRIIDPLNKAQARFTFFELHAPLPVGLVSTPECVNSWLRELLHEDNKRLSKKVREEMMHNIIFNEFCEHARAVHERVGVEFLVGITQNMIAGKRKDKPPFWNYYSASSESDQIFLISVYKLREYAKQAGRPFDVAVAMLVIGELLVDINSNKKLKYHKDTGCIFDFNEENEDIVHSLKELKIEDSCLALIDKEYRQAAADMIEVLRTYPNDEEEKKEETAAPPEEDYGYWVKALTALGEE
jgi:hypothetical protein